jgi:hypothetical protein
MERANLINPWKDIWTQPRATIHHQLEKNPREWIVILAIVNGLLSGVAWWTTLWTKYPDKPLYHSPLFVTLLIIAGAIMGLISLYVGAWLYRMTGKWLGGKGDYTDVKCAVGWSAYPYLISGIFSILNALTVEKYPAISFIFGIIAVVLMIWALIISLKMIGEAHKFSAWRALGAVLLAAVLVFIVFLIILLLIPLLEPLFANSHIKV